MALLELTFETAAVSLADVERRTDHDRRAFVDLDGVDHLPIPASDRCAKRDHRVLGHDADSARDGRVEPQSFMYDRIEISKRSERIPAVNLWLLSTLTSKVALPPCRLPLVAICPGQTCFG